MEDANLLSYVLERLPKQGDPHFMLRIAQVAEGAQVSEHTLLKIAKGETADPRVSTVQSVYDYFKGLEAREAA